MTSLSAYPYASECHGGHHRYLDATVLDILDTLPWHHHGRERRVFELGCGNGSFANILHARGYAVTAVDPSHSGIEIARSHFPEISFHIASAYDDLAARFGQYMAVVSLEVVEHIFEPRRYAAAVFNLLVPGGTAIISTPYHSYFKNLALALSGKMDRHFTALWDFGHIKFWSMKTLGTLLREAGFCEIRFVRVGRVPPIAKSMIAIAKRPGAFAATACST